METTNINEIKVPFVWAVCTACTKTGNTKTGIFSVRFTNGKSCVIIPATQILANE